jgi:hypothetical protein
MTREEAMFAINDQSLDQVFDTFRKLDLAFEQIRV